MIDFNDIFTKDFGLDDFFKYDDDFEDIIKNGGYNSSYKLNLKRENGKYNIDYNTDDQYGKLDIHADGDNLTDVLEDLYEKVSDEINKQLKESEEEEEEITFDKDTFEALKTENAKLHSQVEELERIYDIDGQTLKALKAENADLRAYVAELEKKIQSLKEEKDMWETRFDNTQIDRAQLVEKLRDAIKDINSINY